MPMRLLTHLFALAFPPIMFISSANAGGATEITTSPKLSSLTESSTSAPFPYSATSKKAAPACAVTIANGNAPPGEQPSALHHGNGSLWVVLWPEGKVVFEPGGPGSVEPDGSLSMKFPWWRGV